MKLTNGMLVVVLTAFLITSIGTANERKSHAVDADTRTFTERRILPGGINVEFSVVTLDSYEKEVKKVFDYSFSEISRIASMFQGTNSELQAIADNAGKQPVKVSKEVFVITEHAREVAEWSGGAFDPVRGGGTYKNLKLDKNDQSILLTKQGLSLDLTGILNGFMADLFIRAAYHSGLDDAFVEIGGVRRSIGRGSFGPWQVRITGSGTAAARHGLDITISNLSAATVGGEFPAPEIDARTGKPIKDSKLDSVTIITEKAATADGVANAVYALGRHAGEMLVGDLGIKAVFGYKDGTFKKFGPWQQ